MQTLDQIRNERLKKVETLLKKNKNPYPTFKENRIPIKEAREKMDEKVNLAGRVFSIRGHGKLIFADLKDESEKIQLMFKSDVMNQEDFQDLKLVDMGDFLYVEGKVAKSIRGEISVLVEKFKFLGKSVRPLPEKWHGLKDVEERYRKRYLDLIVNPEIKNVFLTRTRIVNFLREFLNKNGFIEVETPILQPIYGGASAKPFITHHNALDTDLYLRIADELYLKRLVVGGFEKVYEIGHDFRNEGLSKAHNPEFTMLEFYWAYSNYEDLMKFTESMFSYVIKGIKEDLKVNFNDKIYDFTPPWPRITYRDLFIKYLEIDLDKVNQEKELIKIAEEKNLLPGEKLVGYGQTLDILYKKYIRPHLEGPMFIIDHPVELKPLAKRKEDDPAKAASFQLLVAGEELINAYNELNDPQDQKKRWEEEKRLAEKGAQDFQVLDEDYIRALEYGMPPTAGWGLGIDRLTAFLTNHHSVKEVILFPTLRPEKKVVETPKKNDSKIVSREKAMEILEKNMKNKNLIKHCLAVEAAMKKLASYFNEDQEKWGLVGLMHDADWEATRDNPELHAKTTVEWLQKEGENNEEVINAILAHNYEFLKGRPPENKMEWAVYTCDDLTGLIVASTLVLPDKKLSSLKAESVMNKFPSKRFAAGVNQEQIKMCEEKLGIKLEDFVGLILKAMQEIAPDLGL